MLKSTEVIIVGAGPTGVVLATLLGQKNISVLLIEKELEVFPVTRATHLDPETLRNFQATGLIDQLKQYTEPISFFDVVDKQGNKVFEQALSNQETAHYYTDDYFFDQVPFEHILRKGLERYPNVKLMLGVELTELHEETDGLRVIAVNQSDGKSIELTANWLVGCDGGSSFVRENKFPKMKQLKPAKDWILVDTLLKKQEYAALLPQRFRYYLSDGRLAANAHGFGLNRRWEFESLEGESMPSDEEILSWVAQYIDLDKLTVLRIKQYTHRSLITPHWREGRIFLAGDAAHLMPPFAGQGMCSGVRDAVNLAWKLAAVIQQDAHIDLLDSYDTERQSLIKHTYLQTHLLKETLEADSSVQKVRRKWQLHSMDMLPNRIKSFIQKSFANPKPLSKGCIDHDAKLAGRFIPQFLLPDQSLSDDTLGYDWCLIYTKSAFEKAQIDLSKSNFKCISDAGGIWEQWLKAHRIDFALVRPDKVIFSTGKALRWDLVRNICPIGKKLY